MVVATILEQRNGLQMATQWFDLVQLATSNTFHWTIGGAVPNLDMALVEGNSQGARGNVTNYLAHVLRLVGRGARARG